jgi:hypothetical protein
MLPRLPNLRPRDRERGRRPPQMPFLPMLPAPSPIDSRG